MNAVNFLKLDIRLIKKQLKSFAFLFIIPVFFARTAGLLPAIAYMGVIMLMFILTTFDQEKLIKADTIFMIVPGKRRSMVAGRYMLLFIFILAGIILSVGLCFFDVLVYGNPYQSVYPYLIGIIFLGITTMGCIQYCLFYRFSAIKNNQYMSMLIKLAPMMVVMILMVLLQKNFLSDEASMVKILQIIADNIRLIYVTAILFMVIVITGSYFLSCYFHERRIGQK